MNQTNNLVTIKNDTKLYKTTDYDCDSIFDFMKLEPSEPCKTNKIHMKPM